MKPISSNNQKQAHLKYVQKRKETVMDDKWWEAQKQQFYSEDAQQANALGFIKSEHEVQKDWNLRKQEIIEANSTYIDIYDIGSMKPKRLFWKKEANLQKAKQLTALVTELVEKINKALVLKDSKKELLQLLKQEGFLGLENKISKQMSVSSLCGWEIDEHIVGEDDFEIKEPK